MLPAETREDRTKRLFRHYTVGSYDSLTSHRYWQGCGHAGTVAGPRVSSERGKSGYGEWVASFLCLCHSVWSGVYGTLWVQPDCQAPCRPPSSTLLSFASDYVIDDKVAILQKRDHEGFGFVLRGAKGKGCEFGGYRIAVNVFCGLPLPLFPF